MIHEGLRRSLSRCCAGERPGRLIDHRGRASRCAPTRPSVPVSRNCGGALWPTGGVFFEPPRRQRRQEKHKNLGASRRHVAAPSFRRGGEGPHHRCTLLRHDPNRPRPATITPAPRGSGRCRPSSRPMTTGSVSQAPRRRPGAEGAHRGARRGEIGRALGAPGAGDRLHGARPRLRAGRAGSELSDLLSASASATSPSTTCPARSPSGARRPGDRPGSLRAAVVWFDAFTSNVDRTPKNPNLLLWHRRLWLIDHGAALMSTTPGPTRPTRAPTRTTAPLVKSHVLLAVRGRSRRGRRRAERRLTPERIAGIVAAIPDAWLADQAPAPSPGRHGGPRSRPTRSMRRSPTPRRSRAARGVRRLPDPRLASPRGFVERRSMPPAPGGSPPGARDADAADPFRLRRAARGPRAWSAASASTSGWSSSAAPGASSTRASSPTSGACSPSGPTSTWRRSAATSTSSAASAPAIGRAGTSPSSRRPSASAGWCPRRAPSSSPSRVHAGLGADPAAALDRLLATLVRSGQG